MNSSAMRKIIVTVLLLLAVAMLVHAQDPFVACNTVKYTAGTPFALNVDKVLLSLQKKTPKSDDRDFWIHLTKPDVYGHANCSAITTVAECSSCLSTAVGDVSTCGLAVGVRVVLDSCSIRYEAYKF
ncbi:uncharacterized protein M6B38_257395 [Iris pallida]|uniref:Gnk2-homologous domain-containing protein n=1 Tax=Iris pallida TaxID=29817 RepID=A0AAX6F1V0_IRIPA|nr:uncharacterized protein M6B38_157755 [Iris pallida]KAJ6852022.1 uncharacterized protein M6B38_257395 [Iris pallida]